MTEGSQCEEWVEDYQFYSDKIQNELGLGKKISILSLCITLSL